MGAACCIAARDGTIINRSPGTAIHRHSRRSPSWSFRWDSRGRVAGEETNVEWMRHGGCENDRMEVKSRTTAEATFASDDGSPLDSFRALTWPKSPAEGNSRNLMLPSDPTTSHHLSEVKESIGSSSVSFPSPVKLSPSVPSVSSVSESPLSSQSRLMPANATPSRGHHRSPAHSFLRQASDSRILEYRSPTFSISEEPSSYLLPIWGNESTKGSNGGSSDSWSIPAFQELTPSHKQRWSFDSDTSSFSHDKVARNSGHKSGSSFDLQTCCLCSNLLVERSSLRWNTLKTITSNEIAVVAVLNCGHVYHGECLEYMTPEIYKYDPACPICTSSEKKVGKMPKIDTSGPLKPGCFDGRRNSKLISSSSSKGSTGRPFLRRHFSFVSRTSRAMHMNHHSAPRKGFSGQKLPSTNTYHVKFFWSRMRIMLLRASSYLYGFGVHIARHILSRERMLVSFT